MWNKFKDILNTEAIHGGRFDRKAFTAEIWKGRCAKPKRPSLLHLSCPPTPWLLLWLWLWLLLWLWLCHNLCGGNPQVLAASHTRDPSLSLPPPPSLLHLSSPPPPSSNLWLSGTTTLSCCHKLSPNLERQLFDPFIWVADVFRNICTTGGSLDMVDQQCSPCFFSVVFCILHLNLQLFFFGVFQICCCVTVLFTWSSSSSKMVQCRFIITRQRSADADLCSSLICFISSVALKIGWIQFDVSQY